MQNLSPIGWALRPLKNYANFSGRASRAEFWWFLLFAMVFYMVVWFALVASIRTSVSPTPGAQPSFALLGAFGVAGIVMILIYLALLLPMIAVQVRRLHDTNRSGWWFGIFWLIYVAYVALILEAAFSLAQAGAAPGAGMGVASTIFAVTLFVYSIVLLVFFCQRGTRGANRFGEDPYGPDVEQVFA